MRKKYGQYLLAFLLVAAACFAAGIAQAGGGKESKFVRLGDVDVHYEASGNGSQTVLLIPGWACDTSFWRLQVPALAQHYRVLAVDLPGHGKSSAPRIDYTMDLFADAVAAVLNAENVPDAALVVHSMGLQVARTFIDRYPGRCRGLCIVDGAFLRVPRKPETRAAWQAQIDGFLAGWTGNDRGAFLDGFLASMFVEDTPAALREEVRNKMGTTPVHVGNSAMQDFCRPELWTEEPQTLPVLAICALVEDLPPDNEEYMRKLFPRMKYQAWENVGHFLMLERPEKLNAQLLEFLRHLN